MTPHRLAALACAGILALALTGCSAAAKPNASPTPAATGGAATATAAPKPTTPSPTPKPTPVTLGCDQTVTAQQLYDVNPNLGADPGYTPTKGSAIATAASLAGVACGWLNQTSGNVIETAIAHPAESSATSLNSDAATNSHVVPTYGVPPEVTGYFTVENGVGVAQAFAHGYWVVASSKGFLEPGDAQPMVSALLANLPK